MKDYFPEVFNVNQLFFKLNSSFVTRGRSIHIGQGLNTPQLKLIILAAETR